MPRSNWKGSISFGLVNIPVVLYPAQDPSSSISFRQIDKKTGARIKYKRVNAETDKEVPWEQIGKGFEYDKDNILPVEEGELKRVAGENARTIAIESFVNEGSINFVNVDRTYYLVPDKKGDKGYVILREALKRSHKIGVAKVIISTKEYLAAVSVYENALVVYLLHYDEEIRKLEDFNIPSEDIKKYKVSNQEIEIAKKLIDSMKTKWNPKAYKDEYKLAVENWVEDKIHHKPATHMKQRGASIKKSGNVVNFVDLLKKSLQSSPSKKISAKKSSTSKAKPILTTKRTSPHHKSTTRH